MPTLAEIAKKAGVSTAVVSRIVNNDSTLRVSQETRDRVQRIVADTGYTPNRAARSLRSTQTGMIALVVHDVTNPIYAEITRGAHDAAAANGKAILLIDAQAGEKALSSVLDLINGHAIDGLILQAAKENTDRLIARAAAAKIPLVQLQAQIDEDLPVVCLPDVEAAQLGTEYLLKEGRTQIACLATREGLSFTAERVRGWRAAIEAAGLHPDQMSLVFAEPSIDGGQAGMEEILNAQPRPSAVICCNVLAAIGAMHKALERNLVVPDDVAILGIHDTRFAEFCRVPLTTISMPLFELGQEAVRALGRPDLQKRWKINTLPHIVHRQSA